MVLVSGTAQDDVSGLIENAAIVGEPLQAGVISTGGATALRHGFTPPIIPGWPTGIAQVTVAHPPGVNALGTHHD